MTGVQTCALPISKGDQVEVKVMTMTVAGYEEVTKQLMLGNKVSE